MSPSARPSAAQLEAGAVLVARLLAGSDRFAVAHAERLAQPRGLVPVPMLLSFFASVGLLAQDRPDEWRATPAGTSVFTALREAEWAPLVETLLRAPAFAEEIETLLAEGDQAQGVVSCPVTRLRTTAPQLAAVLSWNAGMRDGHAYVVALTTLEATLLARTLDLAHGRPAWSRTPKPLGIAPRPTRCFGSENDSASIASVMSLVRSAMAWATTSRPRFPGGGSRSRGRAARAFASR